MCSSDLDLQYGRGTLSAARVRPSGYRYLVADSSKIGQRDFYTFYRLSNIDALICEGSISDEKRQQVEEFTKVIC